MSFTGEVKDEVSKLEFMEAENISELSAIVNSFYDFSGQIKIITENNSVARRVYSLFKEIYHVYPSVSVRKGYNYSRKLLYIVEVKNNVDRILKSLGITKSLPENFIWSDEDLVRAYLRGLFLVCASVNDPKKSRYHLEFNLNDLKYAKFVQKLLNGFNLNSKVLHRDNRFMVYIKEAEKISDLLRVIGAVKAVLYYEDIRIYRDHKNMTNRLNNCEQANVDRIIETANSQVKDIVFLEKNDAFDLLSDKEKEVAIYRKKYPDASLLELSQIISLETGNKITKSGLYHRFNKIKKFAVRIKNKMK
ncbi:MAG: DNA-binding protein WhiA [Bacilli bacterium]|nr:DNA-binding protein WhiA [Bacilli bacterium]